ncbi:MAG: stalk domain-containing protein [Bacillota bacterium]
MKFKKITASLLVLGVMSVTAITAYAASDFKLLINGKPIQADIQIVDGSSYVPLKVVSETLGAEVKWDKDARVISITQKTRTSASVPTTPSK